MRAPLGAALLMVSLVAGLSGVALAGHNEPAKASKVQGKVVTAYNECTLLNGNDFTSVGFPACHPSVRSDPGCGYDPTNASRSGQMKFIATGSGDIKIIVKAKGLNAGCEGETLKAVGNLRVSLDDCGSADPLGCTVLDLDLTAIPAIPGCVVTGGACSINATVPAGTNFVAGAHTGMELVGFGLKRTTNLNSPAPTGRTFTSGILLQ